MLSRVADALYWMARYLERGEHTARLVAVKLESMVEQTREDADASWHRVVEAVSGEEFAPKAHDAFSITQALAFNRHNPSSLISSLRFARDNARQVREHLSTEVWEHLNKLYLRLQPVTADAVWRHSPERVFREALEDFHTLHGVILSTLTHNEGYHFLRLGRYIERAQLISHLLDLHFNSRPGAVSPKYFDWLVLLKFCCAFEPYSRAYTASIRPEKIAQFLIFDPEFPHSVRFAVDQVVDSLSRVAPAAPPARRANVERLAGRLKAAVDFGQVEDLMGGTIVGFLADITRQCEQIHDAVHVSYISYGAETVL